MPVVTFSLTTPQYEALIRGADEGESANLAAKRTVIAAIQGNLDFNLDEEEVSELKRLRQEIEDIKIKLDGMAVASNNTSEVSSNINNHLNQTQGYAIVSIENNNTQYWGGKDKQWVGIIDEAKIYPSEGECNRFLTPMKKKNPSKDLRRVNVAELS
jgi:hypothetical protein